MYEPPITEKEARGEGFELDDYPPEVIGVWPDNERALGIFARIGSRWQMNPMGGLPHGLRWEAIYPLMDRLNLPAEEWDSLLNDLELMEAVALKTMAEFAPPPPKPKD